MRKCDNDEDMATKLATMANAAGVADMSRERRAIRKTPQRGDG
jgi:hypothetical protein